MKTCLAIVVVFVFIAGCKDQATDSTGGLNPGSAATGVYVLNEGNYGVLDARLSFYDFNLDTVYLDLFENANGGAHLGSVGDDLRYVEGKIYALMSVSENLVVIDPVDHRQLQSATYSGTTPHDMVVAPGRNRIYMTQLFAGAIALVDLTTLSVVQSIPVGLNPQGMVLSGDRLFVCNSGFGADSTVTVVNLQTLTVETVLNVGDGPAGAVIGPAGRVWVLCTGDAFGSVPTNGAVYAINPVTLAVEGSVPFSENLWGGGISAGNDGSIYVLGVSPGSFYGGPVHRVDPVSFSAELNFIPGTFYAIAVDSVTGRVYLTDAHEFQTDGDVSIYESDGTFVRSFTAQTGPSAMAFRRE